MTNIRHYAVGGAVRDALLGVRSKDWDYSVTVDGVGTIEEAWSAMRDHLLSDGYSIFLETPQYLTIRARFPKGHPNEKQTADFVLAREDGPYSDGRRPDWVRPGTLLSDLSRRDYTVNAIAQDAETGEYVDPWDGRQDLSDGVLRAVGRAEDRLLEDPLRAFRALRFSVTKNLWIDDELNSALARLFVSGDMDSVSTDRIRDEVGKMFRHDTERSTRLLVGYSGSLDIMMARGIWLKATTEDK
jgi:tRNA nucleotidyltransferase/poly(A) polymerase